MKSIFTYICNIFLQLTPHSAIKFFSNLTESKIVLLFITPVIALWMEHETALLTLLLFIFLDLVTGVQKYLFEKKLKIQPFKPKTWLYITSGGLRRSWGKLKDYGLGILVIFFLEVNVLGQTLVEINAKEVTLTLFAIILCATIEAWSIAENREAVTGRNILKTLLSFLPEKVREAINKKTS